MDTPLGRVLGVGAEARCAPSRGRRSRIRVSREAAPEVPCAQAQRIVYRVHGGASARTGDVFAESSGDKILHAPSFMCVLDAYQAS